MGNSYLLSFAASIKIQSSGGVSSVIEKILVKFIDHPEKFRSITFWLTL